MKTYFQIVVCVIVSIVLLVTGYCYGLVVQQRYDSRFAAMWEMGTAIKLHKALLAEDHDYARRSAMCSMMHGAMHLNDGLEFHQWHTLFLESVDHSLDKGFRRAALVRMVGMHQSEPEICFGTEFQPEMDAFVPQTKSEQKALDFFTAKWDPATR